MRNRMNPEEMTDEELNRTIDQAAGRMLTMAEFGQYKREQNRRQREKAQTPHEAIYEKEQRFERERKKLEMKTENGLWYISIHLLHKDGIRYRQGYVERQAAGDLFRHYAKWSYGERDENHEINFSRKLPEYVKEICIDLGIRMGKRNPLTGIDHQDPDYDLSQYGE